VEARRCVVNRGCIVEEVVRRGIQARRRMGRERCVGLRNKRKSRRSDVIVIMVVIIFITIGSR